MNVCDEVSLAVDGIEGKIVTCSYQAILHEFFAIFQITLNNKSICFSDFILNTSGKLALGTAL